MATEAVNFKANARSGDFSDFTIVCGDKTWQVHRAVLSCHSVHFKTCFLSKYTEAEQGRMNLKEDPPEVVDAMLQYFYGFEYNLEIEKNPTENDESLLEMHSMVYAVAEKYQAADLKAFARVKFATALVRDGRSILYAVPHLFESTLETDFGLRDICFLSYAMSIQKKKEAGDCDGGNLAGLISSCKPCIDRVPCQDILQDYLILPSN
ncbi:uncharacterized protein RCC_03429 [Ramularia collo-cygni]|uniref:BTB domain-containing protein n=1 Tax=Ramularia collo-cygni TaxID=112498 RepID=A0A2D3UU82_9PEZI|nr:uncharacterized protein RCC_03429 [Ramularia collo-cygni]CZT17595.1 uncharacterized protein RCC_03429 [Ramularia collo-cygni]